MLQLPSIMNVKDSPLVYLTRKTWKYSEGNRKSVILYFVLFVIANLFALSETLIIASILNVIQKQGISEENLMYIIGLLSLTILASVLMWIFHGPARVIENKNAFLVRANYKRYLLGGTLGLPVKWHTDHHSGDTIDKIEKGTNALYNYAGDTFLIIETIVRLIGSYVALVYFNFNSLYIVLIMVALTVWIILRFDKVLVRQYKELFKAENTISAKIYDAISNITTVIILRVEKLVLRSIMKRIKTPLKLFIENNKINEWKWFLVTMCSALTTFLILGTYLYGAVTTGAVIAIGTIYALYGYVEKISGLFFRFAYMYGDIVRFKTAVANAEEVAREFTDKLKAGEAELESSWKEVNIKSLNFSYHTDEGADLHLDDVSFTIKKGEKIAFIGASGSGKTTLLKIIRGLYQPKQLEVRVDGKKMKNGFTSISPAIALIPQEPEIFATTIKENITIGVDHTLEEIQQYTDMAKFTEVVLRLPHTFDSSIVEKGVNLSGGEKQRLALARGLLACKDKSIILLDEPTSSVDFKNEMLIYENIFKSFKDKAIISSIHRLHLLPLFDTIYLFADGKLKASGSFNDLLKESKFFKVMWDSYNSTLPKETYI